MTFRLNAAGFFATGLILFLGAGCDTLPDGFGDASGGWTARRDGSSTSTDASGSVDSASTPADAAPVRPTDCDGTGLRRCGENCVDVASDVANCGACGNRCASNQRCASGTCRVVECGPTQRYCGGVCVDANRDPANCGGCDIRCGAGESCMSGMCVAGRTGTECLGNADCGGTAVCFLASYGWTGGYCSFRCMTDADCGGSAWCMEDSSGQRMCLRGCLDDSQCRPGYACQPLHPANVCVPSCRTDPALVCGAGRCLTEINRCNHACSADSDCSTGSRCEPGTMGAAGTCRCTAATQCGTNMTCYAERGVCGCANDSACPTGHTCDRATGRCR